MWTSSDGIETGTCNDRSKIIYAAGTVIDTDNAPEVVDAKTFTCFNHKSKESDTVLSDQINEAAAMAQASLNAKGLPSFVLTNALRHLSESQMVKLCEDLASRCGGKVSF
jgi:hypothetical protein